MKKTKYILLFLSISFGIYLLLDYLYFQDSESIPSEVVQKNDRVKNLQIKDVNSKEIRQNSENRKLVEYQDISEVDYSKVSENLKITMLNTCNYSSNGLEKNLDTSDLFNSSSEEQLNAKNELIEKCKNWYDYISLLSIQDVDSLEKSKQSILEQNLYFMKNMDLHDKTKTDDAKAIMETGGDSSVLTIGALMYLMHNDTTFINAIAKELETEDLSYIINSKTSVPFLYMCEINPSECSSNSIQMLSVCITDKSTCGLNFIDYYRTLLSGNQFNDYMNIVEIIRRLVENEFFSL